MNVKRFTARTSREAFALVRQAFGEDAVVAAAPYSAASGRLCRELQLDEQLRLACSGEEGWVFVPVLLEGP